ncbi:hypothetical protein BDFG_02551 [Blastomyces dermatitidis ATCC 26199]|nr:hypothetical protein BDFG_02551 [Blastomyces dermatitidis ATCC 26199]
MSSGWPDKRHQDSAIELCIPAKFNSPQLWTSKRWEGERWQIAGGEKKYRYFGIRENALFSVGLENNMCPFSQRRGSGKQNTNWGSIWNEMEIKCLYSPRSMFLGRSWS